MKNFVSVVICTHNRANLLQRVLMSLAGQTLSPEQFEVIVVDDASSDNTLEVCQKMKQEMPNVRCVASAVNLGTGKAAGLGVKSAKGEYLIFTDDDCIPQKDWVEHMRQSLGIYPLVAGCVMSPADDFIRLCHNIAEFHPFLPGRKAGPVDFIAGANMGIRRALFEELNGFTNEMTKAPDMRLVLKARQAGSQVYFVPEARVVHDHNRSRLAEIIHYAAEHASETILLRLQYRRLLNTPFVLRSRLLILLAAPLIALKVTAGIYLGNPRNMKFLLTVPVVYLLKLAWCWGAARGLKNI